MSYLSFYQALIDSVDLVHEVGEENNVPGNVRLRAVHKEDDLLDLLESCRRHRIATMTTLDIRSGEDYLREEQEGCDIITKLSHLGIWLGRR